MARKIVAVAALALIASAAYVLHLFRAMARDFGEPPGVLRDHFKAIGDVDYARAYFCWSAGAREEMPMKQFLENVDGFPRVVQVDCTSCEIRNNRSAVVRCTLYAYDGRSTRLRCELVREKDDWRIQSLGPDRDPEVVPG